MHDSQLSVKSTALALKSDRKASGANSRGATSERSRVGEEILRIARANDVPLRQDMQLTEALAQVDVGATIPPELFRAVAEILSFIHRIDGKG